MIYLQDLLDEKTISLDHTSIQVFFKTIAYFKLQTGDCLIHQLFLPFSHQKECIENLAKEGLEIKYTQSQVPSLLIVPPESYLWRQLHAFEPTQKYLDIFKGQYILWENHHLKRAISLDIQEVIQYYKTNHY